MMGNGTEKPKEQLLSVSKVWLDRGQNERGRPPKIEPSARIPKPLG